MSRWHCKLCATYGLGGPDGWAKHAKSKHEDNGRYGAQVSFGFVPRYDGNRTRYARPVQTPWAIDEGVTE